ncbi:MAG: glycosyltransferase [Candidatus Ratteibacteria bacterium]|jgi:glycosyltransferase involved in cell wall biosynthesis
MKILRILPSLGIGGIEMWVRDFAIQAKKDGHHIAIAAGEGSLLPQLQEANVRWYNLPMDTKTPRVFLRSCKILATIIEKEEPDILHAESRFPCWVAYHTRKKFPDLPWVTSVHSYCPINPWTRSLILGDRIITVSKALAEFSVSRLGANPAKISVVYNGINPFLFTPQSLKEQKPPTIGIVGRLTPGKGHLFFLKALSLLKKKGISFQGIILGNGSERRKRKITRIIHSLNLSEDVTLFSGPSEKYIPNLTILISAATVPEGFGRTVAEAQMAEVPVIAASGGAIKELVIHKKTGYLTTPGNFHEIAHWISHLLTYPEEAREIATRARKYAYTRFSLDKTVSDTLAVYQQLIKKESQ